VIEKAQVGAELIRLSRIPKSDNARVALGLEAAGNLISRSKGDMQRMFDDSNASQSSERLQLDLEL